MNSRSLHELGRFPHLVYRSRCWLFGAESNSFSGSEFESFFFVASSSPPPPLSLPLKPRPDSPSSPISISIDGGRRCSPLRSSCSAQPSSTGDPNVPSSFGPRSLHLPFSVDSSWDARRGVPRRRLFKGGMASQRSTYSSSALHFRLGEGWEDGDCLGNG